MDASTKCLDPEGEGRFRFLSFRERVALVDINPLHRDDFLGELAGDTNVSTEKGSAWDRDDGRGCEVSVVGDQISVVSGRASAIGVSSAFEAKRARPEDRGLDEAAIDRRIYQKLRSTYTRSALIYWKARNGTKEFARCYARLAPLCESLPQLLLRLPTVVQILLEEIEGDGASPAREAIYHILAILGRDVHSDLASLFPTILPKLMRALDVRNPQSLEWTFYTLGLLLRFLYRFLLKDLETYLRLFVPWLSHRSAHVRTFAAECMSFLLRKERIEALPAALGAIVDLVVAISHSEDSEDCHASSVTSSSSAPESDPAMSDGEKDSTTNPVSAEDLLAEGFGRVLFEIVKNVQGSFTSKLDVILDFLAEKAMGQCSSRTALDKKAMNRLSTLLGVFFFCARNHTESWDSKPCEALQKCLQTSLDNSIDRVMQCLKSTGSGGVVGEGALFSAVVSSLRCVLPLACGFASAKPSPRGQPARYVAQLYSSFYKLLDVCMQADLKEVLALCCRGLLELFTALPRLGRSQFFECIAQFRLPKDSARCGELSRLFIDVLRVTTQNVAGLLEGDQELHIEDESEKRCQRVTDSSSNCLNTDELWQVLYLLSHILMETAETGDVFVTEEAAGLLAKHLEHCRSLFLNDDQKQHFEAMVVCCIDLASSIVEREGGDSVDRWAVFSGDSSAVYVSVLFHALQAVPTVAKSSSVAEKLGPLVNRLLKSCVAFFNFQQQQDGSIANVTLEALVMFYHTVCLALKTSEAYTVAEKLCQMKNSSETSEDRLLDLILFFCENMLTGTEAFQMFGKKRLDTPPSRFKSWHQNMVVWMRMLDFILRSCADITRCGTVDTKSQISTGVLLRLLRCCIVAAGNPHRGTRRNAIAVLRYVTQHGKDSGNPLLLTPIIHVSKEALEDVHVEAQNIVLSFPESTGWVCLGTATADRIDMVTAQTWTTLEHVLDDADALERIQNSLCSEREKIRCIERLGGHILTVAGSYGTCFLTLFLARLLVSQLSEKFLPLWDPTVKRLQDVLASYDAGNHGSTCGATPASQDSKVLNPQVNLSASTAGRKRTASIAILRDRPEDLGQHGSSETVVKRRRADSFGQDQRISDPPCLAAPSRDEFQMCMFHFYLGAILIQEIEASGLEAAVLHTEGNQESTDPVDVSQHAKRPIASLTRGKKRKQRDERFSVPSCSSVAAFGLCDWLNVSQGLCSKFFKTAQHRGMEGSYMFTVRQTDPHTRHNYYCRLMGAVLSESVKGKHASLRSMLANQMSLWIPSWTLHWAVSNALGVLTQNGSKADSVSFIRRVLIQAGKHADHFHRCSKLSLLLRSSSRGSISRLLDSLRMVMELDCYLKEMSYGGDFNESHTSFTGEAKRMLALWPCLITLCTDQLLSIPDPSLQKRALQIAQLGASPVSSVLSAYQRPLESIVTDSTLSQTLLSFSLEEDKGLLNSSHGPVILPILMRLLLSKLFRGTACGKRAFEQSLGSRRQLIFQFLSQLPTRSLPLLLSILVHPHLEVTSAEQGVLSDRAPTDTARKRDVVETFLRVYVGGSLGEARWWFEAAAPDGASLSNMVAAPCSIGYWRSGSRLNSTLEDSSCDYIVSFPVNEGRLTRILGLLATLSECITQMRLVLVPFIPFIGQLICSILGGAGGLLLQAQHKKGAESLLSQIGAERCRRVIRQAISQLDQLIRDHPNFNGTVWAECLAALGPTLVTLLDQSLQGGGSSTILSLICDRIARTPELFHILEGPLQGVVPVLLCFPLSRPVLAALERQQPPNVGARRTLHSIIACVLRLCQGGLDDLEGEDKEERKRAFQTAATARSQKKRRHALGDESSEDEAADTCVLVEDTPTPKEVAFQEYLKWKQVHEDYCARGRAILRPYVDLFLSHFAEYLAKKKTCQARVPLHSRIPKKRGHAETLASATAHLANDEELRVILSLAQAAEADTNSSGPSCQPETVCKLLDILRTACPKGKALRSSGGVHRFQMILSAVGSLTELLYNTDPKNAEAFQSWEAVLLGSLPDISDLETRHDVTRLLFRVTCAASGRAGSPRSLSERLVEEALNRDDDQYNTPWITPWLPDGLKANAYVARDAEDACVWRVTVAALLVGLTALRPRVTCPEPHYDLHMRILTELLDHGLLAPSSASSSSSFTSSFEKTSKCGRDAPSVRIPAVHQAPIVIECLFMIRAAGIDPAVRTLAVRTISTVIERVAAAAQLRHRLDTAQRLSKADANSVKENHAIEKLETEWLSCHILFKGLFYSVMTCLRSLFRRVDPTANRSGLHVLSILVQALAPHQAYLPLVTQPSSFFDPPVPLHAPNGDSVAATSAAGATKDPLLLNAILVSQRCHLDLWNVCSPTSPSTTRPEEGGHVFNELLHIQKHRRARGLALLTQGLNQAMLQRTTALNVCVPLAFLALTQPEAEVAFHLGLAEKAIDCLAEASRRIRWTDCLHLIKKLVAAIRDYPKRETFFIRAVSRILSASLDTRVEDAVAAYNAAVSVPLPDVSEAMAQASKDNEPVLSGAEGSETEDEKEEETVFPAAASTLDSDHAATVATDHIKSIQRSIRWQLLPLLRKMLTVTPKPQTAEANGATSAVSLTPSLGHTKQPILLVRPQVVSAQLLVMRHLPVRQFHEELPRLLQTLATCLGLRDREARRKARAALCSIVVDLGPRYFSWIISFISQSLTKGYQVSVLSFTAISALLQLVYGVIPKGKALLRTALCVEPGAIDEAPTILLPLVLEELDRFCDPDRPEFQLTRGSDSVLARRAGVDEQRHFRSNELILVLCRACSFPVISKTIIKFLYGLLTGSTCGDRATARSATGFTRKYRNMVQQLFDQAVAGIAFNPSCAALTSLQLTYRMLRLQDILLTPAHRHQMTRLKDETLREEENAFLEEFLHNEHSEACDDDNDNRMDATQNSVLFQDTVSSKRLLVQPGAATGSSAEQVLHLVRGVDTTSRANVIGVAALRLFLYLQRTFKNDPYFKRMISVQDGSDSKERQQQAQRLVEDDPKDSCPGDSSKPSPETCHSPARIEQLLDSTALYIIRCFCGTQDALLVWASKCLTRLLVFNLPSVQKNGKKIALSVLQILQKCGSNGGCAATVERGTVQSLTATCTRVLAVLLTYPSASHWFHQVLGREVSGKVKSHALGLGTIASRSACTDIVGESSGARTKKLPVTTTLKSALLSHIRASLDDPELRLSALELFRRIILLPEKAANLENAEHAALVYQCIDEIGVMLVQQRSFQPRLTNVCGRLYVDFLMAYPMTERIQQKRFSFILRHLSCPSYGGRKAILSVLYELIGRMPPTVFCERYASITLLALILRLASEEEAEIRLMVRAVIERVLKTVPDETTRLPLLSVAIKAFLVQQIPQRAALVEFLDIASSFYSGNPTLFQSRTVTLFVPTLEKCLTTPVTTASGNSTRNGATAPLEPPRSVSQHPIEGFFDTDIVKSPQEKTPETFSLPASITVTHWKILYLALRYLERLVHTFPLEHLVYVRLRDVDHAEESLDSPVLRSSPRAAFTFCALWRYFLTWQCKATTHPMVRSSCLQFLRTVLTTLLQGLQVQSKKNSDAVVSALVSAAALPELSARTLGNRQREETPRRVTPLVSLLWDVTQWSREKDIEKAPRLAQALSDTTLTLCQTLLCFPKLADECEYSPVGFAPDSSDEEETEILGDDSQDEKPDDVVDILQEQGPKKAQESNPLQNSKGEESENHASDDAAATAHLLYELTSNSDEADIDDDVSTDMVEHDQDGSNTERNNKLEARDADSESCLADGCPSTLTDTDLHGQLDHRLEQEEAEEVEAILLDTTPDTVRLLEKAAQESERISTKNPPLGIMTSDRLPFAHPSTVQDTPSSATTNLPLENVTDELIQKTRIRWVVGRVLWSIKLGLRQLPQHAVRIATGLKTLYGFLSVLPPQQLNSDPSSLLRPIIEALYLCGTLKRRHHALASDATTRSFYSNPRSMDALESLVVFKDNPKTLFCCIGLLGEELLNSAEQLLTTMDKEAIFHTVLNDVRSGVSKRRTTRKREVQLLKARDPQGAAERKVKRQQRKREGKKRQMQRYKAARGAA